MPLVHAASSARSRCEDDDDGGSRAAMSTRSSTSRMKPQGAKETKARNHTDKEGDGDDGNDTGAGAIAPMSPRVRKRLDDAKENASLFNPGTSCEGQRACLASHALTQSTNDRLQCVHRAK